MKIELDLPERAIAKIKAYMPALQAQQLKSQQRWDSLCDAARGDLDRPHVPTEAEVLEEAVLRGISETFLRGKYPNTVICINETQPLSRGYPRQEFVRKTYKKGDVIDLSAQIPIGAEILAMTASPADGPNWTVTNLVFGAMNIISPCGTAPVPLTELVYLTNKDLLSVFDGNSTKVDVQFYAQIICQTDDATFDGFRLHIYQEEQIYAILTRVESTSKVESRVFPCERVLVDYGIAIPTDTPTAQVKQLVADLRRTSLESPGVWVDGTFVTLVQINETACCIQVSACMKANTSSLFYANREALVLALRKVVEDSCRGKSFRFQIGKACDAAYALYALGHWTP